MISLPNVSFGGYLSKNRDAFIVYMFRRAPEVWGQLGDNALSSWDTDVNETDMI